VTVCFLIVGHTHEDIDQFFSTLSRYLDKRNVGTLSELQRAWNACFRRQVITEHIDEVPNVKEAFAPYLKAITGHTTPHQWRFTRNGQGKCVMQSKSYSTDPHWTPDQGHEVFDDNMPIHPEVFASPVKAIQDLKAIEV
jgi:hypothetical protein